MNTLPYVERKKTDKKNTGSHKKVKFVYFFFQFYSKQCFVIVETWILFRKNKKVVSNAIQEAYRHYESMEFGIKKNKIKDPQRHIKLINIAGNMVLFYFTLKNVIYFFKISFEILNACFCLFCMQ